MLNLAIAKPINFLLPPAKMARVMSEDIAPDVRTELIKECIDRSTYYAAFFERLVAEEKRLYLTKENKAQFAASKWYINESGGTTVIPTAFTGSAETRLVVGNNELPHKDFCWTFVGFNMNDARLQAASDASLLKMNRYVPPGSTEGGEYFDDDHAMTDGECQNIRVVDAHNDYESMELEPQLHARVTNWLEGLPRHASEWPEPPMSDVEQSSSSYSLFFPMDWDG
jgi:hypothetical protein